MWLTKTQFHIARYNMEILLMELKSLLLSEPFPCSDLYVQAALGDIYLAFQFLWCKIQVLLLT